MTIAPLTRSPRSESVNVTPSHAFGMPDLTMLDASTAVSPSSSHKHSAPSRAKISGSAIAARTASGQCEVRADRIVTRVFRSEFPAQGVCLDLSRSRSTVTSMPTAFDIRAAVPADVAAILQLIRDLAEYERALNEVVATEETLRD